MHTLIWTDDFANFKWHLTYNDSQSIYIEISKSYIEIPEASESVIKFNISVKEFSEQLYLSLKKMLSIYGLVGFKTAWEVGNFPVAEYIKLSAKYNNIHLSEYNTFEDDDGGLTRFNLDDELRILQIK